MADPRTENEEKFADFLWMVLKLACAGIILYQCFIGHTI